MPRSAGGADVGNGDVPRPGVAGYIYVRLTYSENWRTAPSGAVGIAWHGIRERNLRLTTGRLAESSDIKADPGVLRVDRNLGRNVSVRIGNDRTRRVVITYRRFDQA